MVILNAHAPHSELFVSRKLSYQAQVHSSLATATHCGAARPSSMPDLTRILLPPLKALSIEIIMLPSMTSQRLQVQRNAGLYGVTKKFVGLLLEDYATEADRQWWNLSRASKATITARGQRLRVTADFGRAYRSIIKYWRSWTMEEYLHFLETYSLYLFSADLMDARMWTMWNLLRSAIWVTNGSNHACARLADLLGLADVPCSD